MHIHSFFMYFASDVEIVYVKSFFFSSPIFSFCLSFVLLSIQLSNQNRILVLTIPFQFDWIWCFFVFSFWIESCNIVFCYSASSIECIIHVSAHASNRKCIIVVLVRMISLHKHKMYLLQKYNIFEQCREWMRNSEIESVEHCDRTAKNATYCVCMRATVTSCFKR